MKKQQAMHVSSTEFIASLNKYVPSLVMMKMIQRFEEKANNKKQIAPQPAEEQLPQLQRLRTVVMFADISGFTACGEACAKKGIRGNEELAFCINSYMDGMVKQLNKYGGDIIKFVGDAMIVMWPHTDDTMDKEEQAILTVRKAVQCAQDIQKEMNNKQIIAGVTLSVKLGIGFGDCALLYVGGVFRRSEFFTVGDALTLALQSEECATAGGQIIVAQAAFDHIRSYYKGDEIINDHGKKFYRILERTGAGIKSQADALIVRNLMKGAGLGNIQGQLSSCVPAAILPFLKIGYEQFGSETRFLTIMFASLGVDLSSAQSPEGMQKIQKIVTNVQEQVYRLQGSVNKLVMDDKGSTLICLWGLNPYSHEDDAARAILTALNMRKSLAEIDNTWCNIGISSGDVFSGVVGTSGSRKEFSVLGDTVNLAARIMFWPLKFKQHNKINVCLTTRNLASNTFQFTYGGHKEFKGKSVSIPIYEPKDPEDEYAEGLKKKLIPFDQILKVHANPLIIEKHFEQINKQTMYGLKQQQEQMARSIIQYFSINDKNSHPWMAAITGPLGSGKTLFARSVLSEVQMSDEFSSLNRKLPIFVSTLNAESEHNFLNSWRLILMQMLSYYSKKENLKKEQIVKNLCVNAEQEDKMQLMYDLFGIKDKKKAFPVEQVQQTHKDYQFISRIDYSTNYDEVLELVVQFIKIVIDDADHSFDLDQSKQHSRQRSKTHQISHGMSDDDMQNEKPPYIIVLDNVERMDSLSWQLFETIRDECSRVGIILIIQTDSNDQPKYPSDCKTTFNEIWNSQEMENLIVFEMPRLDARTLNQILQNISGQYQRSWIEEVTAMISIENPDNTIKTPAQGVAWKSLLYTKYQLYKKYASINGDIIATVIRNCIGNPILCFGFFQSLLQNDVVNIDATFTVMPQPLFLECNRLNEWSSVPVPKLAIKLNCTLVDKFLSTVVMKAKKQPNELENVVRSIIILKAAAVLGEEFNIASLATIQPIRGLSRSQIIACIKELENQEFLEIIDQTDKHNFLCRFNKSFLRDTLYQISLYRDQKKGMHHAAADFMQNNNIQHIKDPEVAAGILRQHILISQDIKSEDDMSFQARTSLLVRRIQNLLEKNPKAVVKHGYLTKQGEGVNRNVSKRLIVVDSSFIRWYHDEKEFQIGKCLGQIPLHYVFHVISSKLAYTDESCFSIGTASWVDKRRQEQDKRDFFFGAETNLIRDEWIITIDYLRTKAVYDNYTKNNIPLQFNNQTEEHKDENEESEDLQKMVQEFGSRLKVKTNESNTFDRKDTKRITAVSRKASVAATRLSNFDSVSLVGNSLNIEELKNQLKALYIVSKVSFMDHINKTAVKTSYKSKNAQLGSIPDGYKSASAIFKQPNQLTDLVQRSSTITHPLLENQTSTPIRSNRSNDFMTAQSSDNQHYNTKRDSSVSADNITKVTKISVSSNNELIREVSEKDYSSDERQDVEDLSKNLNKRSSKIKAQTFHAARSPQIEQRKNIPSSQKDSEYQVSDSSSMKKQQQSANNYNRNKSQIKSNRDNFMELNLNETSKNRNKNGSMQEDFQSNSSIISQPNANDKSKTNLMSQDSLQNMRQFITHSIEEGLKQIMNQQQLNNSHSMVMNNGYGQQQQLNQSQDMFMDNGMNTSQIQLQQQQQMQLQQQQLNNHSNPNNLSSYSNQATPVRGSQIQQQQLDMSMSPSPYQQTLQNQHTQQFNQSQIYGSIPYQQRSASAQYTENGQRPHTPPLYTMMQNSQQAMNRGMTSSKHQLLTEKDAPMSKASIYGHSDDGDDDLVDDPEDYENEPTVLQHRNNSNTGQNYSKVQPQYSNHAKHQQQNLLQRKASPSSAMTTKNSQIVQMPTPEHQNKMQYVDQYQQQQKVTRSVSQNIYSQPPQQQQQQQWIPPVQTPMTIPQLAVARQPTQSFPDQMTGQIRMIAKGTQVDVLEYNPTNGTFKARLPSIYADKGQPAPVSLFSQTDFQFIELGHSQLDGSLNPNNGGGTGPSLNQMSPIYPSYQQDAGFFKEDTNDVQLRNNQASFLQQRAASMNMINNGNQMHAGYNNQLDESSTANMTNGSTKQTQLKMHERQRRRQQKTKGQLQSQQP